MGQIQSLAAETYWGDAAGGECTELNEYHCYSSVEAEMRRTSARSYSYK